MLPKKIILKPEEAKKLLALNNGMVHTFLNASFGLVGADHSKESIYKDIDNAERLEITGEQAQAMGHGLAILPKGAKYQKDILFVETKKELIEKYNG